MALVDPNIAMSFRAPEIKPRNALAEYAQMQQIVGGQRQAEVAELQLDALRQEREALKGIQEAIVAKGGPPDLGAAADAMIKTGRPEYLAKGIQIRQMVANQNAWSEYQKQFLSPESAVPAPSAGGAPANVLAPTAAATPPVNALAAPDIRSLENRYRMVAGLDTPGAQAEAKLLLEQIKSAQTGAVPPAEVKTMQVLGYPLTAEGYRQYRAAQMAPPQPRAPVAVLQGGRPVYVSPEQAVGQTPFTPASVQVLGMGAGREAPAPTITQIQDPTNPNQMITINARVYQGGGVGSPGVIGTTGKTPAATAAAVKQEQGQSQAQDIIDNLRGAYTRLNDLKAIPSTQRGVLSNVLSSIAASAPGQIAGRAAGTEEQTQRDIIQSARNQLFAAVKNATGLSAQNLNSNVEFTTWLNSLTDPSKSYQTNERILDELERFIASGGKYSAKPKPADGGKPTPSKPGSGVDTSNPLLNPKP